MNRLYPTSLTSHPLSLCALFFALSLHVFACADTEPAGEGETSTTTTTTTTTSSTGETATTGGEEPECVGDEECFDDLICDQGRCVEGVCTRDSDCELGQICLEDQGVCVTPECLINADCPGTQFCDQDTKTCQPGCSDDTTCPDGFICNVNTRSCEPDSECNADPDCGDRALCVENKCIAVECLNDAQCPLPGEICDLGSNTCRRQEGFCAADEECEGDQKCDLDTNTCLETSCPECPEGTTCNEQAGECWECARDEECGEGRECNLNTNTCEDTGCQDDSACGPNQTCNRITGECQDVAQCQDDSFEPNNLNDAARSIGEGNFTGLTICEADEDWFAVEVSAGDTLTVDAVFAHVDGNLDLELYDPNNRRIGASSSNSDNEQIQAGDLALSGTYLLRIFPLENATNNYALNIDLEAAPTPTCEDDGFEDNDSQATAVPVIAQTFQSLSVCPGDSDWYKLRLNPGERLTADVSFTHAEGDLDLVLFAPNGETIVAESRSADDNESAQTPPSDISGDYLILVQGASPALSNTYQLTLSKDVVANPCSDDTLEPNDAVDEARTIQPDLIDGLTLCPGNDDYYAVSLNAGDNLSVEIDFAHDDGDLELAVFRPDDLSEPIAQSRTRTNGEVAALSNAPISGLYIIRVFGASPQDTNTYLMLTERTEPPNPCEDDGFEDNDNREQPAEIADGSFNATICSGDEDWFSIEVDATGSLLAEIEFDNAQGDLDLEVYSPNGDPLGSSSSTDGNTEGIELADAPISGRYLLRVLAKAGGENTYSLTTITQGSTCDDDAFENNDSQEDAELLDFGSFENLTICPNDDDFYAVILDAGDGLTASVFFDPSQGDLDLILLDEAGRVLASSVSAENNEEATILSVEEGGLYYARVYGFLGDSGDYSLNLTRIEGGTSCEDDFFEPNDSQSLPFAIEPSTVPNLTICPNDDDWFSINVAENEILDVSATFSHVLGDIDFVVLDPNGAQVAFSAGITDEERVTFRASIAGDYLIRVYGFSASANDYSLSAVILPPETCLEDSFEENDTGETAFFVSTGTTSNLAICREDGEEEEDWFKVFAQEGQNLTVTLVFAHNQGDFDLEIYNENDLSTPLASSRGILNSEEVNIPSTLTATYVIRVIGFAFNNAGFSNEYDMIVSLEDNE